MRTNMVGTTWMKATRQSWIAFSAWAASNFFRVTAVAPLRCAAIIWTSGAEW
jgi:hypothetical protein